MRIALVSEYYYPHLGGISEHVHFFAREMRRRGHHVDVITSRVPGAAEEPGVVRLGRSVRIYANGSVGRLTVGRDLRRKMRDTLRRGRYDVVHVHGPFTSVLGILAVDEAECAVVGTFHTYFDGAWAYNVWRKPLQRRLDRMQAAIAVSPSAAEANACYFHADWRIVPNGVDVDFFHPLALRPPEVREEIPSILFLGRFDPRNGLAATIEAFRRVRGRDRPAQLVVVGDGPLRRHYQQLAAGDPGIRFVGPVLEGRPGFYAGSAVYACPTTKASFGITLLEAMACATPVVCSDIPGFRDVVADGREARMVSCGDDGALADALVELLDDEGLRERLGATGRARALDYSWSRVADTVSDIYLDVLGHLTIAA